MTGAAALALASLLLGAGELRVDSGVRIEGLARQFSPEHGRDDRALDGVVAPRAGLDWRAAPELRLWATYVPRLRAPDLTRSVDLVVLHTGVLRAEIRPDPAWRLAARAGGERGTTDLVTESRATGVELQTITTLRRLRYRAARADVELERLPGRRAQAQRLAGEGLLQALHLAIHPPVLPDLRLAFGAFVDGGEGAAAEALLPLERGVRAEATAGWSVTRLDRVGFRLAAVGTRIERGMTSAIATADALWRRRLTRELDGWAGAGAAGVHEDPPGGTASTRAFPSAELGLARLPSAGAGVEDAEASAGRPSFLSAVATLAVLRLAPAVDRATGEANPELEGTLSAGWLATPRWSLSLAGMGAVVRDGGENTRRWRIEARTSWTPVPTVQLSVGVYGLRQRTPMPDVPSFDEWGAFLALELDPPSWSP
ncbi:hypothetical protein Adeh_2768 [Anaeromyxobacter dehalogenans 2CP-C]|uniref:Alginate export domain-containing protein n=1 Tax=Anaeromyxobacter dehalogenans (strain 2CP-C) TaxID=290397 RepID=Q2ILK7_ANADE|nr:hypothetical protein Adeh_2768 [Anaeromyxobacter dehalogenans 2CP-C]